MRFLCLIKSSEQYGTPPAALIDAMDEHEREARAKGILLDGSSLLPSETGVIMSVAEGRIKAVDGPFTEAREVVGGYVVVEASDREEAVELGRGFMELHRDHWPEFEGSVEIRQLVEY